MSTAALSKADVVALARRTPLTRPALIELTKKIGAAGAREAAMAALEAAGAPAAMVLAFVAAGGREKLDPALTRALIPEVLSLDQVGPLVSATAGGSEGELAALVGYLDDKTCDLELECLAMLLAADLVKRAELPTPRTLLTRGRWLARHQLNGDAAIYLGGAALRLQDADLSSLATPHMNRARRAKKTIEEMLETTRTAPLDVLPDVEGGRLSSGFTVKHAAPAVGRNDPCPCGSGKKYKKCHALSEEGPASIPEPKVDAATIGPEQAALLRPSEIEALETTKLPARSFVEAFRRVVDFRQWPLAFRMLDEAAARKERDVDLLTLDALQVAYDARALDAAEKLHQRLPPRLAEQEAFAMDCLRAPPDMLDRIVREADGALRSDADGTRGIFLASVLLRNWPALGIYVARGALHEGRPLESQALLQQIEDARDRQLLSPSEAWWDVYDAFFEEEAPSAAEQKKDDAKRAKMKEDLRRARAASRKTAAELEKVQERIRELDALTTAQRPSAASAPSGPVAAPSPELADERRKLKTKIEELQRIIGEGQEERRELRRQLAEREEDDDDGAPAPARARAREDEEDEDADDDGAPVDAPRGVLVPRFSDRAAKAVTDLAGDTAELVLSVVAALGAGKPNAWGGVKQLAKVRTVFSARAGIHHRVLFTTAERSLDVVEVIHRRELEQVVARLARGL